MVLSSRLSLDELSSYMTRVSKQKASRQAVGDDAVSPRFLDALETGLNEAGEQKAQLSTALDAARHLHLQQPPKDDLDNSRRFKGSVDCAVKAWRSATKIYAEIFESLAKATEADPSEFSNAKSGHTAFLEIARIASEAERNAREFVLFEELENPATQSTDAKPKTASQDEDDDGSSKSTSSEPSQASDTPRAPTPSDSTLPRLLNRSPRPGQPIEELESTANPMKDMSKSSSERRNMLLYGTGPRNINAYNKLGNSERKVQQAEEHKRRREKKQAKRAARRLATQGADDAGRDKASDHTADMLKPFDEVGQPTLNGAVPPDGIQAAASTNHVVPMVEYEDVSAEVSARLEAKKLRKEAAKQRRKRKRESGDSIHGGEVGMKAEMLKNNKKKKVTAEEGGEIVDVVTRKHELEDAEPIENEVRRKRKKSKA